ncbi:DUF1349 domain-containing protein [Populibacterium corticicola]|uniref:DUF1349 domain-containing protein n=1 Tax=Populibacterium corticicola TaxID=1812826 RepID=A0ABW5XEY2_9MICO
MNDPELQNTRINWSEGTWTNEPAITHITDDGVLHVTAVEGSDAWRHTAYGFVHESEHALGVTFAPGTSMEVDFGTNFTGEFDQAGLYVRVSNEHWVKAGVEFADGAPQLGAVVTRGTSDWSSAQAPEWGNTRVSIRVSWRNDALTFRARRTGTDWQLLRVLPLTEQDGVTAGPFVCGPTHAGLEVPFYGWRVGSPDTSIH